jgi:hypothetical protein
VLRDSSVGELAWLGINTFAVAAGGNVLTCFVFVPCFVCHVYDNVEELAKLGINTFAVAQGKTMDSTNGFSRLFI